ncbi:MAG TPA: hypothetical protein VFM13_10335 [Gaiellaceae bacterium]|nr:hypothetical protein [Gaiellaceae bacterium]
MRAIVVALVASSGLVLAYLALGGASYAPAKVADPCAARDWRSPSGFQEAAQQIVLSALDGAACDLGVSREQLVLAFESRNSLRRFARRQGIGSAELERILRSGLVRAVDDAAGAGALDPAAAGLLRELARRIPVEALLNLPDLLSALDNRSR